MSQHTQELPVLQEVTLPTGEIRFDIVNQMWDEAERALVIRRTPKPTQPRPDSVPSGARVRYEHD